MRRKFLVFLLFLSLLLGLWAWDVAGQKNALLTFEKQDVTLIVNSAPMVLSVEMANTPEHAEQGLMYRRELQSDGMVFVFPEERRVHMWMKNTLLPLDMVFFDAQGVVVHVHKGAVPESLDIISSVHPSKYVLEVLAGQADARGIKKGDRLDLGSL